MKHYFSHRCRIIARSRATSLLKHPSRLRPTRRRPRVSKRKPPRRPTPRSSRRVARRRPPNPTKPNETTKPFRVRCLRLVICRRKSRPPTARSSCRSPSRQRTARPACRRRAPALNQAACSRSPRTRTARAQVRTQCASRSRTVRRIAPSLVGQRRSSGKSSSSSQGSTVKSACRKLKTTCNR